MNKKLIRLTEGDLHNIVKESVNKILREATDSRTDGALEYQGGDNYKKFWDKRANSPKVLDYLEKSPSKDTDHIRKMLAYDEGPVDGTHGMGKWHEIVDKLSVGLQNVVDDMTMFEERMDMNLGEKTFLQNIGNDIYKIIAKLNEKLD